MSRLADRDWEPHYTPERHDLVRDFYIPALSCAERYDRMTGYFTASALALAMRGVEYLVVNGGHMKLLVGCTLSADEVAAIERGEKLKDTVDAHLMKMPLVPPDPAAHEALELLAWMIAKGHLEVKVAVPCDENRKPVPADGIYHSKAGIIEDKVGDRIGFSGSINETASGWRHNRETFHVFKSWDGGQPHIDPEEREFGTIWSGNSKELITVDVPKAKRDDLLRFMPEHDHPARLRRIRDVTDEKPEPAEPITDKPATPQIDRRKVVWSFIRQAPAMPNGGEQVGEATAAISPWPHQVRAFDRMYHSWPPRLLIADEVGLGKTIQAGLVLRQAWLAGRVKRILIMAPKAVCRQWQIELREKFNLNWPIYDRNELTWRPCPTLGEQPTSKVSREDWHKEPCVIVSSHLMRRADRAKELLEDAEPWDLIVLDEAHHARRRAGGLGSDARPNQLLKLMRRLRDRSEGLILLTATPMQVSAIEVWDLLSLLGLPADWTEDEFVAYFRGCAKPSPSNEELAHLARRFRSVEAAYGEMSEEDALLFSGSSSKLKARKVLKALRADSSIPLRQLDARERQILLRLLKANSPARRLISRHTRRLLRKYYQAGKISTPIATRNVDDRFVDLSETERSVYEQVERYISSTYNNAAPDERNAIGFVMTIYRRRLASSFYALQRTLRSRLNVLRGRPAAVADQLALEEDALDDETADEVMGAEDVEELELRSLRAEEEDDIRALLASVEKLPTDTKAEALLATLSDLRGAGYKQAMVFTQFTDSLEFLRGYLVKNSDATVMCFSGRGGEALSSDGRWTTVSRDETKRRFRDGKADVLVCTDAAAEGLNFQFCGALINYDMPWNPMRVEQRIGRIDRLGQRYGEIRIANLHYADTVETDVYMALRRRIRLFEDFVGGLQPILSTLSSNIRAVALSQEDSKERLAAALVDDVRQAGADPDTQAFDLDEITEGDVEEVPRPPALYGLAELGQILEAEELLPPGDSAKRIGNAKDFAYLRPGLSAPVRVTTDRGYYEEHADSVELWSPGSPVFPDLDTVNPNETIDMTAFRKALAK